MIKCLMFADMHLAVGLTAQYKELLDKEYDAYFILGDTEYWCMKDILKYIPLEKTYGILGNHDDKDLYEKFGIKNIHGKLLDINGVTFTGFQYSEKYSDNDRLVYTQEESIEVAKTLPKADVLLSHTSPLLENPTHYAHTGLLGISEYIKLNEPKYNIHGHHHKSFDYYINDTHVIGFYRIKEFAF